VFSAGGIKLVSGSWRITIDNTLDERLRLLEDRVCLNFLVILSHSQVADFMKMLPEIRKDLFGANENRKFYT
jgi:V-type H+-transporting ATPase subunit E